MPDTTFPTGVSPKRTIPPYVDPCSGCGGGGGSGDPLFALFTAGVAVEAGEVVYLTSGGLVALAQADAAGTSQVLGVVKTGGGIGDQVEVYILGVCLAQFDADNPPPAAANGGRCWLSQQLPGRAQLAPDPPGTNSVVAPLGLLLGADGTSATVLILLRPGEPAFGG